MSKDFRGASGQEQSCELSRIESPTYKQHFLTVPPHLLYRQLREHPGRNSM